MIEIEAVGEYFETDENGFIINPCAPEKIAQEYVPLLDRLIEDFQEKAKDHLLAIYLRGSVPAGKAIAGISDLDVVGLLKWQKQYRFIRWGTASWENETNAELLPLYPFVKHIDLAIAHHDPSFPGQNLQVKMILKTQGICIWGQDILRTVPPFRPGKAVMINYKWVAHNLQIWKEKNDSWETKEQEISFLKDCLKTTIRAGFELVLQNEGRHTVDLYPCYESFSKYYPEKEKEMRQALFCYLNIESSLDSARILMDEFVPWLAAEIQTVLINK